MSMKIPTPTHIHAGVTLPIIYIHDRWAGAGEGNEWPCSAGCNHAHLPLLPVGLGAPRRPFFLGMYMRACVVCLCLRTPWSSTSSSSSAPRICSSPRPPFRHTRHADPQASRRRARWRRGVQCASRSLCQFVPAGLGSCVTVRRCEYVHVRCTLCCWYDVLLRGHASIAACITAGDGTTCCSAQAHSMPGPQQPRPAASLSFASLWRARLSARLWAAAA